MKSIARIVEPVDPSQICSNIPIWSGSDSIFRHTINDEIIDGSEGKMSNKAPIA